MSIGEAAGKLLTAYIDKITFQPTERRELLQAIPAECRFIDANGQIAYMITIQAIFDYLEMNNE